MLFSLIELIVIGLFLIIIYLKRIKFFSEINSNDYHNIMITYILKKHINKSIQEIENQYFEEKITNDEFFLEDENLMDYFQDLLVGDLHRIQAMYCRGIFLIHYDDLENFNESVTLAEWFMKFGIKNFDKYHFYIVCENNYNETTTFLYGENKYKLLTNQTSDEIIMDKIFK